jgi:hypothetical protein
MNQRSNQRCPNCGGELSPHEVTVCERCGQLLPPVGSTQSVSPSGTQGAFAHSKPTNPLYADQLGPTLRAPIPGARGSRWLLVLAGVLVITICLLIGIKALAVVQSQVPVAPPHVQATAAPTPIPMVRVTITLVDVLCDIKENGFWSHDQFYMMSTFSAPDKSSKSQAITQPHLLQSMDITSGQDLKLSLTVFDGQVPLQGQVKGGFTAYNDTQQLAWENIASWTDDIGQAVAGALTQEGIDSGNLGTFASGVLLDLAVKAWYGTANLNSDNAHQLGEMAFIVPASGLPSETQVWHFNHYASAFDNWDYTVKYQITRTPVTVGPTSSPSKG